MAKTSGVREKRKVVKKREIFILYGDELLISVGYDACKKGKSFRKTIEEHRQQSIDLFN